MTAHEQLDTVRDHDNLVVFYHGNHRSAQRTLELVKDRLGDGVAGLSVEYEPTSPDATETRELVLDKLDTDKQRNVATWVGGDGTGNDLLRIWLDPDTPATVSTTPLGTFGGGGARNWYFGTTSKKYWDKPDMVVEDGEIDEFFPLLARIETADGIVREAPAASILGFGATAIAAGNINHPDHRDRWLRNHFRSFGQNLADGDAIARGLLASRRFLTKEAEDGSTSLSLERLYLSAPQTAKIIRARGVEFSGQARRVEIRRKNPLEIASVLLKLRLGIPIGEDLATIDGFRTQQEGIFCQVDGEDAFQDEEGNAEPIPAETDVTVSYSPTPIRFIRATKK